jgi:hypothetical protein
MEWIKVQDRLPQEGQKVICLGSHWNSYGSAPEAEFTAFLSKFHAGKGWDPLGYRTIVVGWMPLPEHQHLKVDYGEEHE